MAGGPSTAPTLATGRITDDPEKQQVEEVTQDDKQGRNKEPSVPELRHCPSAVAVDELAPGYAKLAGRMGLMPSTKIFRSFSALNAQNLLYLQAELIELELDLREYEAESLASNDFSRQMNLVDWSMLNASPKEGNGFQWLVMKQIRPLLKEYNETLLTVSKLELLEAPKSYDISAMWYFVNSRFTAGEFGIHGNACSVWGHEDHEHLYAPDLVALAPHRFEDSVSRWMVRLLLNYGGKITTAIFGADSNEPDSITTMRESSILHIIAWLAAFLAAGLPVAAIVALYYVSSVPAKFAVIAAFNLLVSSCITAFTNAKRTDVFAVTAAFAALQVVFVGVNEK